MRSSHRASLIAFLALVAVTIVLAPLPARAQGGTATATVTGKILDDTGGVLPGVTITLTNVATNQSRTVVTNQEGRYTSPGVLPGKYSLTCELPGFATFVRPEITVNVGSVVTLDVTMRVSTLQETVTVTGEAPIVEINGGTIGCSVTFSMARYAP